MPEITVTLIVPVHAKHQYVSQMLDSISNQRVKPDMLFLIDDLHSSTTSKVLRQFVLEYDHPVMLLVNESNLGISVSTNSAVQLTYTSHVGFLDADDLLVPDAISRLKVIKEKFTVYSSLYETFSDGESGFQKEIFARESTLKSMHLSATDWNIALLFENVLSPFKVISTDLAKKFPWEKSMDGVQDFLLNYTISTSANVMLDNQVTYKYRTHDTQISKSTSGNEIALRQLNLARLAWKRDLGFYSRKLPMDWRVEVFLKISNSLVSSPETIFIAMGKNLNFAILNFNETIEFLDSMEYIAIFMSDNFDQHFVRRAILNIFYKIDVPLGLFVRAGDVEQINFLRLYSGLFDFAIFESDHDLKANIGAIPSHLRVSTTDT
jgi:glycosyltransferase involved in cell wall biosynthesis